MAPSAVVRVPPFSAIAAVVLVVFGALLGATVTAVQPPAQLSVVAVQSSADPAPATVSAGSWSFRSMSTGDDCAFRCVPECGGADHDCVAVNPSGPLRTAEPSLVVPLLLTGAVLTGPAVFRPQHRPAPSLLLLSVSRI